MKKCLLIFQLFLLSNTYAQCTFEHFFNYYAGEKSTMIPLNDGGYLIYGTVWADTIEWSSMNLILIKTDSCGSIIWVNNEGYLGAGDPSIYAIEMDSGNIMVVGYTAAGYTARIAKYNKKGQLVKEQFLKKNTDGFVNGITKNTQFNTYLIFGRTNYIASSTGKPLITEIDENLNIIRRKEFLYSEISSIPNLIMGNVRNLIQDNNNQYYGQISVGKGNVGYDHLVELDSSFSIKKCVPLALDTLYSFAIRNMLLNKDQNHFDCIGGLIEKENDPSKQFVLRMDTNGNIKTIRYLNETISDITSMSPTMDGGYITGPQLLKLDSNLNTEWMKPTRGKMFNVEQLPDGGYITGGISTTRTILWGLELANEVYLVKMDKNGNYIHLGINDNSDQSIETISIYPNPSYNGLFTIRATRQPYQTVTVYNTTGQPVFVSDTSNQTVDLSNQANGLYYIYIQDKEGNCLAKQKVLLQK